MGKEKNVIEFYMLCNKLKNMLRAGWKVWNVKSERIESVAEHIFGVQMLAIAMWSEYQYNIDIKKVITMIAVHETEEIIIGDLTPFDISRKEKEKVGHEAVKQIFSNLSNATKIENLIYEMDSRQTQEAQFAYFCDKMEADIQAKIYDENNPIDVKNMKHLPILNDAEVQKILQTNKKWSEMWIDFGQKKYNYDTPFMEISNYIMNNKITK